MQTKGWAHVAEDRLRSREPIDPRVPLSARQERAGEELTHPAMANDSDPMETHRRTPFRARSSRLSPAAIRPRERRPVDEAGTVPWSGHGRPPGSNPFPSPRSRRSGAGTGRRRAADAHGLTRAVTSGACSAGGRSRRSPSRWIMSRGRVPRVSCVRPTATCGPRQAAGAGARHHAVRYAAAGSAPISPATAGAGQLARCLLCSSARRFGAILRPADSRALTGPRAARKRDGRRGELGSHLRGADRRDALVLGRQRPRAARRWDADHPLRPHAREVLTRSPTSAARPAAGDAGPRWCRRRLRPGGGRRRRREVRSRGEEPHSVWPRRS
jgi:hypothetical protein